MFHPQYDGAKVRSKVKTPDPAFHLQRAPTVQSGRRELQRRCY